MISSAEENHNSPKQHVWMPGVYKGNAGVSVLDSDLHVHYKCHKSDNNMLLCRCEGQMRFALVCRKVIFRMSWTKLGSRKQSIKTLPLG